MSTSTYTLLIVEDFQPIASYIDGHYWQIQVLPITY
jgi:hypothetical protein